MIRRLKFRKAIIRKISNPTVKDQSQLLAKFTRYIMRDSKLLLATRINCEYLKKLHSEIINNPKLLQLFEQKDIQNSDFKSYNIIFNFLIKKIITTYEIRNIYKGGAKYIIPYKISERRQNISAMKRLIKSARQSSYKDHKPIVTALYNESIAILKNISCLTLQKTNELQKKINNNKAMENLIRKKIKKNAKLPNKFKFFRG